MIENLHSRSLGQSNQSAIISVLKNKYIESMIHEHLILLHELDSLIF